MSEVNIPLLRKAVEWAEAEAERTDGKGAWNQGLIAVRDENTHCGTAFCVAGWALHASGMSIDEIQHEDAGESDVLNQAARLLGVRSWTGSIDEEHLFDPYNTIADVRRIAEDWAGERL